jgi:preprotein translocase subunit YajC
VNWWPYVVIALLFVVLVGISLRNRRRQAAEEMVRVSRIGVGTEVMTTSGLYGTVTAKHDDGTVLLSVAPGVEVKWAAAALRDAASLNASYRRGMAAATPDHPTGRPDDPGEPGTVELRKDDGEGSSPENRT